MPSSATITAYYTFSANTKARSSQVNANFSLYRGHVIPIEPLTATGSDITYDLGSSEYRWRSTYTQKLNLVSSTSTAALEVRGNTSATLGAMQFYIANTLAAQITPSGFDGAYIAQASVAPSALTQSPQLVLFDTSGTWVVPTGTTQIIVQGAGGGGGGAGGAGSNGNYGGGGGGGGGAPILTAVVTVTPGETLTVTLGGGGAGGAGGGAGTNNTGTAGSAGSTTTLVSGVGSFGTLRFPGGVGGTGGTANGAGGAGAPATSKNGGVTTAGGSGATQQSTTGGADGEFSVFKSGGAFNATYGSATTGGGGGGGGGCFDTGGLGGAAGASGIANPTNGVAGAQGSGGGGGGGGANGSGGATGGAGGSGRVRISRVGFTA